jgi:hypothetical protein
MSDSVNIPGRNIVALLQAEAKRKPAIARLIEQASTMTDSEIDQLKVPLPWYKKALKANRISPENAARMARAMVIVDNAENYYAADPDGTMRRYDGITQFITVSRGNMLEIRSGKLLWFPKTGGVWIDTSFSDFIDPALSQSTFIGETTKSGYSLAEAKRRLGDAPTNVPYTVVDGAKEPSNSRFTIF